MFVLNELSLFAQQAVNSGMATLAWNPSSAGAVTGYLIRFGLTSGAYTDQLAVDNTNSVIIQGLKTNTTYYFVVVARNGTGAESPPSNEISYFTSTTPAAGPTLGIGLGPPKSADALSLSFPGTPGGAYIIETSTNLLDWVTIFTTNCASNGTMVFHDSASEPARFYRLEQQ